MRAWWCDARQRLWSHQGCRVARHAVTLSGAGTSCRWRCVSLLSSGRTGGHGCLPWECCVLVGNVVVSVVSQLLSCDRPHVCASLRAGCGLTPADAAVLAEGLRRSTGLKELNCHSTCAMIVTHPGFGWQWRCVMSIGSHTPWWLVLAWLSHRQ